jgi:hypothetical protein
LPHFKGLSDDEILVKETTTVNALPAEHKRTIIEFSEFIHQLITHIGHGGCVIDQPVLFSTGVRAYSIFASNGSFERDSSKNN